MLKVILLASLIFTVGCDSNKKPKRIDTDHIKTIEVDTFNLPVVFRFINSEKGIGKCQKQNYDTLLNGFPFRNDSIRKAIADFYRNALSRDIDPIPRLVSPLEVDIPGEGRCENGTFDLIYKCGWDRKNEIRLSFHQWAIEKVDMVDIVSF